MDIKRGIVDPAQGERFIAVEPTIAPNSSADWQRRLHFFKNRALSDTGLITEQTNRAVRLNLSGRAVSPGVLNGLEIGAETLSGQITYRVNGGYGLTALGETVSLPHDIQLAAEQIRVRAPEQLLAGGELVSGEGVLLPRSLSQRTLRNLVAPSPPSETNPIINLPRVGILLLEPVIVETDGDANLKSQCLFDETSASFNDLQLVDGVRLVWYTWPTETIPLPAEDKLWRSRLAYTIFDAESKLGADEMLPWEHTGIPLALVGLDAEFNPQFIDGSAVRRLAGRPKRRAPLLSGKGNQFMWQARMEQLAEQLAEAISAGQTPEQMINQLRFLPPAGLLPTEMVETVMDKGNDGAFSDRSWKNRFFPPYFKVQAVPVPIEQLDVALEASVSLNPVDIYMAEAVELMVPVPQSVYEPDLLQVKAVDPEFELTINEFVMERTKWLTRRKVVRQILATLFNSLNSKSLTFPEPDSEAQTDENDAAGNLIIVSEREELINDESLNFYDPKVQESFGVSLTFANDEAILPDAESIEIKIINDLKASLSTNTPLNPIRPIYLDLLPELPDFDEILKGKLNFTPVNGKFGRLEFVGKFGKAETDAFNSAYDGTSPESIALKKALPFAKKELILEKAASIQLDKLDELGLIGFIGYLEGLINQADDKVNLGFGLARTDMYRVRQMMLGTLDASRLATSPALASIVQGESAAVATKEDITNFVAKFNLAESSLERPESGEIVTDRTAINTFGAAAGVSNDLFIPPLPITKPVNIFPGIIGVGVVAQPPVVLPATPIWGDSSATTIFQKDLEDQKKILLENTLVSGQLDSIGILAGAKLDFGGSDVSEVIGQTAIIGKSSQIRNVTVGERISQPPALEGKHNASASIYDTVFGFESLELHTDDLDVFGELDPDDDARERQFFSMIDLQVTGFTTLLNESDRDGDEAELFSNAIDIVDRHVGFLRQVEGRVQAYRQALEQCRDAMRKLQKQLSFSDSELKKIEDEVAESRHDVAVGRALLAEETERVAEINRQRDEVIQEHVNFYAFVRPRLATVTDNSKFSVVDLNPAIVEPAVPECFAEDIEAPDELLEMVDLWRDVPLRWLKHIRPTLEILNRPELLQTAFLAGQARAKTQIGTGFARQIGTATTRLGSSIRQLHSSRQQDVLSNRLALANANPALIFSTSSYQTNLTAVESLVSLGDLLNVPFGRRRIDRQIVRELENIADISACLYVRFSDLPPILRLNWAERLSQFDESVRLRNLATLPDWESVDYVERRQMQQLVDWLYGRINPTISAAQAMMDDLIRVCILLASHAPVNQITAGEVEEKVLVRPGGLIKLAIDPSKVRIGHKVLLFEKQKVIGQAVVQNMEARFASAEIIQSSEPDFELLKGASVQIGGTSALKRNPITRHK